MAVRPYPIDRRKATRTAEEPSPWKLGGLSVTQLARRVWSEMSADDIFDRAAGLAYYFVFALFPTLLFLTALMGIVPGPNLMDQLMGDVDRFLPPDAASIVSKTLAEIVGNARKGLLSIGAVTALWAASAGMASMMEALNAAYGINEPRPWWKRRLIALALTSALTLLILTALVLWVFGGAIGKVLTSWVGLGGAFATAWAILQWPVAALCVLAGSALVYHFGPAVERPWRWVTPGSAFALATWFVMSLCLRFYVSHFANYSVTYGSIGGVILLLLWLYLTGLVFLAGAEIDAEIEHAAAARSALDAERALEGDTLEQARAAKAAPNAPLPRPPLRVLPWIAAWAGLRVVARVTRWSMRLLPRRRFAVAARARRDEDQRPRMPKAG